MAKGRKAIPPELKDNGTYKDIGAIKRQEACMPRIDSAVLKPPRWLSDGAKKEWRRVVSLYNTLEITVLNDLDQAVLIGYVIEVDIRDRLYQEWLKEEKLVDVSKTESTSVRTTPTGAPIEGKKGESKKRVVNPVLRELERHNQAIRILAEQLALTPAGRAAYAVRKEKAGRGPAEEFMGDD